MSNDARQIANWFIERAKRENRTLTTMSILKLCFLAQEKHLEKFKHLLFENKIEAWDFGPVIPEVYESLRLQGIRPTEPIYGYPSNLTTKEKEFLEVIYKRYSVKQPSKLVIDRSSPILVAKKKFGLHSLLHSLFPKELFKFIYFKKSSEI